MNNNFFLDAQDISKNEVESRCKQKSFSKEYVVKISCKSHMHNVLRNVLYTIT